MTRKMIIWTLVTNMFILVGAGHGVAPMGLLEIFALSSPSSFPDRLYFSLSESYDHLILSAVLFMFLGQIVLIVTLALRDDTVKFYVTLVALILLYIGVVYLSINGYRDSASSMSFITAIPFLILSIIGAVGQFRIYVTRIK